MYPIIFHLNFLELLRAKAVVLTSLAKEVVLTSGVKGLFSLPRQWRLFSLPEPRRLFSLPGPRRSFSLPRQRRLFSLPEARRLFSLQFVYVQFSQLKMCARKLINMWTVQTMCRHAHFLHKTHSNLCSPDDQGVCLFKNCDTTETKTEAGNIKIRANHNYNLKW